MKKTAMRILLLLSVPFFLSGCAGNSSSSNPSASSSGIYQTGLASYYGEQYHGNRTASGETYNMNALTAAHQTLAFGTMVEVERLDTGRRVTVRINDRGPNVEDRIIDLSKRAASELGMISKGLAMVSLRIVGTE